MPALQNADKGEEMRIFKRNIRCPVIRCFQEELEIILTAVTLYLCSWVIFRMGITRPVDAFVCIVGVAMASWGFFMILRDLPKVILAAIRYRRLVGCWPATTKAAFEEQKRTKILPLLGQRAQDLDVCYILHPSSSGVLRERFYGALDTMTSKKLPAAAVLFHGYQNGLSRNFGDYLEAPRVKR